MVVKAMLWGYYVSYYQLTRILVHANEGIFMHTSDILL